ncbi:ATP-binding protein [Pararhodospirillum oryzae]|nr:ATP-binding protein [Pararhodospirillum oryzae]
MTESPAPDLLAVLTRLADALDRLAPPPVPQPDLFAADAFIWSAAARRLEPVPHVNRVPLELLCGIGRQVETLRENTLRFARGLPANNALLWGARGTGKSSLVKAVHAEVNRILDAGGHPRLALVEIHREDIPSLPTLLHILAEAGRACVLFCDDLSFDGHDTSYKSLKAVLEGGIEGRPTNVVFYATSNRRHLLAREMVENEQSTALHAGEAVEEKVSLSDRFGLWLGFHNIDQPTYLAMVLGYAKAYGLDADPEEIAREAREWAVTRGSRSGRTAWQYIQDLAGRLGRPLPTPSDV